jgi:hypothetical protein
LNAYRNTLMEDACIMLAIAGLAVFLVVIVAILISIGGLVGLATGCLILGAGLRALLDPLLQRRRPPK